MAGDCNVCLACFHGTPFLLYRIDREKPRASSPTLWRNPLVWMRLPIVTVLRSYTPAFPFRQPFSRDFFCIKRTILSYWCEKMFPGPIVHEFPGWLWFIELPKVHQLLRTNLFVFLDARDPRRFVASLEKLLSIKVIPNFQRRSWGWWSWCRCLQRWGLRRWDSLFLGNFCKLLIFYQCSKSIVACVCMRNSFGNLSTSSTTRCDSKTNGSLQGHIRFTFPGFRHRCTFLKRQSNFGKHSTTSFQ